jgi:DMSO/TMAO reductase YedYZ heme-binding membrane subunit
VNGAWHELSRATGLAATVLLVLALAWGLAFSARATGTRRRPNWWLDLHNYLGGLGFAVTLLHLATVLADHLSGIGLVQLFVPMTADGWAWGITWGVLATYVLAAVVLTSWPGKATWLSGRAWLAVHLLSVPATLMVAAHAWMVGSSRDGRWFQALLAVLTGAAVYPGVLRLAQVVHRRSVRRTRQAVAS